MLSAFQMAPTTLASSALGYRQVSISCQTVLATSLTRVLELAKVNLSVLIS